ncbi:hypothetical protein BJX70DRAFT_392987 [Aspergillus crustosus]
METVDSEDRPANPFLRLPAEIIQHIAYLLPTKGDIVRFVACSSDLAARILPAESHIWRRLFRDTYDDLPHRSSVDYKIDYQIRSIVLSRSVTFAYGEQERQSFWLKLLVDMLHEGLVATQEQGFVVAKNFQALQDALMGSDFLNRPVNGYMMRKLDPPSGMFVTVQLYITYMALDPLMAVDCLRTDYDIGVIYCIPRHQTGIGTFYTSYMGLPQYHRPSATVTKNGSMSTRTDFPLTWLGYESTTPDLDPRQTCADLAGHMVEIEHIILQLEQHPDAENWPKLFSDYFASFSGCPQHKPTLLRGIQTYHGSAGTRSTPVRGFVEEVRCTGLWAVWWHICFVAYERPPELLLDGNSGQGSGSLFNEIWPLVDINADFTSIYMYEGVIVPGKSLILGQWSDFRRNEGAGPFIFWNI